MTQSSGLKHLLSVHKVVSIGFNLTNRQVCYPKKVFYHYHHQVSGSKQRSWFLFGNYLQARSSERDRWCCEQVISLCYSTMIQPAVWSAPACQLGWTVLLWKNYCVGIELAPIGDQFSIASHEIPVLHMIFVLLSEERSLLGMRCFMQDSEMDTTVGKRNQLLLVGRSSILCITARREGERRHEPPSSLLTLIRFARLMSSAVMVLCVGTVLSSCCGWICSGWFSDCCSSADCVSDGTGVCSCCSNPFSVACPASSNCPLLEKCSKSWNRKSYNQWLFPPPTEKCFDITQQTTRFLHNHKL